MQQKHLTEIARLGKRVQELTESNQIQGNALYHLHRLYAATTNMPWDLTPGCIKDGIFRESPMSNGVQDALHNVAILKDTIKEEPKGSRYWYYVMEGNNKMAYCLCETIDGNDFHFGETLKDPINKDMMLTYLLEVTKEQADQILSTQEEEDKTP